MSETESKVIGTLKEFFFFDPESETAIKELDFTFFRIQILSIFVA